MTHAEQIATRQAAALEQYVREQIAAAVDPLTLELAATKADRAEIASALAASEDQLAVVRDRQAEAQSIAQALTEELTRARARIAELEASTTPKPPRPLLGACPLNGGMNASGIVRVTERYGAGAAVRLFSPSGWTPAPALGDAGRLLLSWKPDLSRPVDEAACLTALAAAPAGSKVCVWHEPDVKARKGDPVAPMKARAAEFYRIVKAKRPDLDVMAVLSGWTFDPSNSFDPLDYIDLVSFDVLALDLDGLAGPKDYRPVVAEALAWMKANGVKRWTVAEYGVKTTAGFTTSDRLRWLSEQTTALLALPNPPEEIVYFETESSAEGRLYIMTPAELELYRALRG